MTAKPARRIGMVASVGGVVGLMASAGLSGEADTTDFVSAFSVISFVGIVMYATAELTDPRFDAREEPTAEKYARWARILTERCFRYAREGNCRRVRRVEPRVLFYDRVFHDTVFMGDPEIATCMSRLTDPPPEGEASPPSVVEPRTPDG
ncbi:MAG TPA: hypothetical protein VGM90_39320 [Kofleriaceae bacterium]|jgi:hypothetical protein